MSVQVQSAPSSPLQLTLTDMTGSPLQTVNATLEYNIGECV